MLLQKLGSRVCWRPAVAVLPSLQRSLHSSSCFARAPVALRQHLSSQGGAKGPAVHHLRTGVAVRHAPMSTQASGKAAGETAGMGAMVVYITCGNDESANKLSAQLVENKLAACVNIVPGLTSVYQWEGKIENDKELLLIVKTKESLMPELTEFVKKNHPYDEPEVIGLPVQAGSPTYLSWLISNTKSA